MTLSLLLRFPRLFSARHWRRALAVPGLVWAVVLGAGAVAWAPLAIAQAVPGASAAPAGNKAAQPVRPAVLKGVTESGKPVDLAASQTFALNGIERTDKIEDLIGKWWLTGGDTDFR